MKNDSVPRGNVEPETNTIITDEKRPEESSARKDAKSKKKPAAHETESTEKPAHGKNDAKKKKKRNLWPLKAMLISFGLSFLVNVGSELVLNGAQLWLASVLTVAILALGVFFDMIGTAATSCDVQPFLAMASRKVKGAKTAVRLSKNSDVVSSVCCDIVGDICGIVSGVCAAAIATKLIAGNSADFWITVAIYALISTATISLKALGKGVAVNKANGIVFNVAKILSIFTKDG
ncbi:MAG: hypothetical protein ACI4QH_00335 [Candidatus Fimimonas sp.]